MSRQDTNINDTLIFDNEAWGIPLEAVKNLGNCLLGFWERFKDCFKTKTHDTSEYAYHYLSGQLRMEGERNYTKISRERDIEMENLQHFMSNSSWSSSAVYQQVQKEIKETEGLQTGGVLLIDESADEKAGEGSAGAAKQYNGRLGKTEVSQVGVFAAYANLTTATPIWTWVEGSLYIPKKWFGEEQKWVDKRKKLGIPEDKAFKTKIELAWELIKNCKKNGLPFEMTSFDCLYGRSGWLRYELRQDNIKYMAEIPKNTRVYIQPPEFKQVERRGKNSLQKRKVIVTDSCQVQDLLEDKDTEWHHVFVRPTERGEINDKFAARRVWTMYKNTVTEEWLVMREESDGRYSYALSNASEEASLEQLAWWKCQRYFVERSNQDAKSQLGWDELEAQKYRAWEHHLALTILACWFIMQLRYDWARKHPRSSELFAALATDFLPPLSVANIRSLLRSVMPLRQLTPEQMNTEIMRHLYQRTKSRRSRLRKQKDMREAA